VLSLAALAVAAGAAILHPVAALWALTAVVITTLIATATLKGLALGQLVRQLVARQGPEDAAHAPESGPLPARLPRISVLVALFDERDVATTLLPRLERLTYPSELTDIILLAEEGDAATIAALAATPLPRHMRWIAVPPGTVMTKPRALNYGLGFARGEIVGIWDAEDAPDPDQLHAVAAGFARAAPHVACLQGALDFYNARTNWLSRCFTLEYGTWFRGFLPGLRGLDLPIPLGGTTLFFRRAALERLGAWDAHNVTEDADLGIRLYRAGFRTDIIETTTREEANCRVLPWIRQRSRWMKGYAITWAVHMRRPTRLWHEMGPRGFFGFNALFVGTLVQFALTPVMLSFWLLSLGALHPLSGHVPPGLGWAFLALFAGTEAISTALTLIANRAPARRWLWWWIPTLQVYYPLATLAAYRGLWELISRPFYWDKTEHGLHAEEDSAPSLEAEFRRGVCRVAAE
jgi:cellulose synthase/poly-beta-1,6-N-acetylglucosamine synthase-like glycosyltransferase